MRVKRKPEEAFVSQAGEETRGFFKRAEGVREKVYDCFFEEELDVEIVEKLQENVSEFVEEINKNPITAQAIQLLADRNSTVADHSVNVANLSVYLAMALGHGHQFILENVYMGSIFHDYGKAKISEDLLTNKSKRFIHPSYTRSSHQGGQDDQKNRRASRTGSHDYCSTS